MKLKLPALSLLFSLAPLANAGELVDKAIEEGRAHYFDASGTRTSAGSSDELDPITVYGRQPAWALGLRLRGSIPCLGCDGRSQDTPFALEAGKAFAMFLVRPLFQQPRVKGEPNDEAAYYALRMADCPHDSAWCSDSHFNPGLYDWQPSERAQDDWILNGANMILRDK